MQNRVAIAEPRLPEEVRRIGVTTDKSSPDLLLVVVPDYTFRATLPLPIPNVMALSGLTLYAQIVQLWTGANSTSDALAIHIYP